MEQGEKEDKRKDRNKTSMGRVFCSPSWCLTAWMIGKANILVCSVILEQTLTNAVDNSASDTDKLKRSVFWIAINILEYIWFKKYCFWQ